MLINNRSYAKKNVGPYFNLLIFLFLDLISNDCLRTELNNISNNPQDAVKGKA